MADTRVRGQAALRRESFTGWASELGSDATPRRSPGNRAVRSPGSGAGTALSIYINSYTYIYTFVAGCVADTRVRDQAALRRESFTGWTSVVDSDANPRRSPGNGDRRSPDNRADPGRLGAVSGGGVLSPASATADAALTPLRGSARCVFPRYRGTSLTRKRTPLGPYRRPMPRVLGGS